MSREDDDRRCPFCHVWVPADRYRRHVDRHQEVRDDGQMRNHVTLPPEERRRGQLADVPRVYRHPRCREETVMPDDILCSYLENPFLYNDQTFCCGCNGYVPHRECTWVETGERLDDYFDRLKEEAERDGRGPKPVSGWMPPVLFALGGGFVCGLLGAKLLGGRGVLLAGFAGFVLGGLVGFIVWLSRAKPSRSDRARRDDSDVDDRPRWSGRRHCDD